MYNTKTDDTETNNIITNENGRIGWILLWLIGIPIPILLVLYFIRGCT
ncbi:MAG: hypothetical protein ACXVCP_05380 [Bdellovibrio sp.]